MDLETDFLEARWVGLDGGGGGGGGLLDMFDLFVMFNTCRYRAGSCKLPVL
jgi:hypothetical protein